MVFNYGELSIDSKGSILLPKFRGFKDGSELVLYLKDEYIILLTLEELGRILKKIESDNNLKVSTHLKRRIFPFCISVNGDFSNDNGIRINLPREIILKYQLDNKLIYEIVDNKIRLWHPAKYQEYIGNFGPPKK